MNKFKETLRDTMTARGWNQKQLADAIGKSPATVSQWVNGHIIPPKGTIREVAKLLQLHDEDLTSSTLEVAGQGCESLRMNAEDAARILGLSLQALYQGLKNNVFPWGYAIEGTGGRFTYYINKNKFCEMERVPFEIINDEKCENDIGENPQFRRISTKNGCQFFQYRCKKGGEKDAREN